jgi:hypothetical protein
MAPYKWTDANDIVEEIFDRYVYGQLTDGELQEALLTEGVIDDLQSAGDTEGAIDIVFGGLPDIDED